MVTVRGKNMECFHMRLQKTPPGGCTSNCDLSDTLCIPQELYDDMCVYICKRTNQMTNEIDLFYDKNYEICEINF